MYLHWKGNIYIHKKDEHDLKRVVILRAGERRKKWGRLGELGLQL